MSAPVFINITPYTIEYNGETTLHPIITSEAHDYQEEVFYIFIKQNPLAITPEGTIVTINRKRRIFDLKYNTIQLNQLLLLPTYLHSFLTFQKVDQLLY